MYINTSMSFTQENPTKNSTHKLSFKAHMWIFMFCDKYYFISYILHTFKFFKFCCLNFLINLNLKLIKYTYNNLKNSNMWTKCTNVILVTTIFGVLNVLVPSFTNVLYYAIPSDYFGSQIPFYIWNWSIIQRLIHQPSCYHRFLVARP
jgi:hypothetical protein